MSMAPVRSGAPGRPVEFDERWQEVWQRRCRGETWPTIAAHMGAGRNTVQTWYKKYALLEIERRADADSERAFLLYRFENMAFKAMEAFDTSLGEDADWKTDPRPAHMANAIKALQMVARLSGFDVKQSINLHQHRGESEITIKVGGETMVRRRVARAEEDARGVKAIEVGARELDGSGDGSLREAVAAESEASGDG